MTIRLAVFVVVLLASTVVAASEPLKLTDKNYETITSDPNKIVFVKIWADWCGACKKIKADFDQVTEHFAGNQDVVIAEFNGPEFEDYARNVLHVGNFPGLVLYDKGTMHLFSGQRTAANMIAFVEKHLASLRG